MTNQTLQVKNKLGSHNLSTLNQTMIRYSFCKTKVPSAVVSHAEKGKSGDKTYHFLQVPALLTLLKQKLGLSKFLFSQPYIKRFSQSDYITLYKTDSFMTKSAKTNVELLSHLLKQERYILGAYINFLYNQHQWEVVMSRELISLTDLSTPHKWYQGTRKMARKFIYHHGPTNSGKTLSAIQSLEGIRKESLPGIYMAPLRLLAWQIQQRLSPCTLVTGQEKIVMDSHLTSCTIETANMQKEYRMAVIDEIQMIGDDERGWAWTKSILNTKSPQIHLCGQSRPLQLISKLCSITGDQLQEKKYPRLSRLILVNNEFKLRDLQPGDAVIAFGVKKLHRIRNQIRRVFKKDCAIIYGNLPPEVRKQQTEYFNSGQYPFLVSTNAIGMGLNLHIKRIVFYQTDKMNNKKQIVPLEDYEIQQIAGRAGRGLTDGYVFCMSKACLARVRSALINVNHSYDIKLQELNEEPQEIEHVTTDEGEQDPLLNRVLKDYQKSIQKAKLFIQFRHLQQYHYFAALLQTSKLQMKLSITINEFFESVTTADHYSIIEAPKFQGIVRQFEFIGLNSINCFNFSNIPLKTNTESESFIRTLAFAFHSNQDVRIPPFVEARLQKKLQLKQLQITYFLLQTYIWLHNKYEVTFTQPKLANLYKDVICQKISEILAARRPVDRY